MPNPVCGRSPTRCGERLLLFVIAHAVGRKSARRLEISASTAENSKRLAENSPSQGGGGLTLLPVRTMRLEVPERELSSKLRKAQVCSWE